MIYQPTRHVSETALFFIASCYFTAVSKFIAGIFQILTHNSGRVTQICLFNTVKLGTSASSP